MHFIPKNPLTSGIYILFSVYYSKKVVEKYGFVKSNSFDKKIKKVSAKADFTGDSETLKRWQQMNISLDLQLIYNLFTFNKA